MWKRRIHLSSLWGLIKRRLEVKVNNTWVPVRIEMGDDWYLVGLPVAKLSGLTVRM